MGYAELSTWTLGNVRARCKKLRNPALWLPRQRPAAGVTVLLAPGLHDVGEGLALDARDSNTTWRSAQARPPRVPPLCVHFAHAQGSSGDVAPVPIVWRGRTKSPTTRAGPSGPEPST